MRLISKMQDGFRKSILLGKIGKIWLVRIDRYSPIFPSPNDLLDFWFQEILDDEKFQKSRIIDTLIRLRCMRTLLAASSDTSRFPSEPSESVPLAQRKMIADDDFEDIKKKWATTDIGLRALIILFDQFPRNIFRNSPKGFSFDAQALHCVKCLLNRAVEQEKDWAKNLSHNHRVFVLMPFMHSEEVKVQKEGFALFQKYAEKGVQHFAKLHLEIVERFGRFPHRNQILGRKSTSEELKFLKEPNSSF